MSNATLPQGTPPAANNRYWWTAVGVLGAVALALGAALVQVQSHNPDKLAVDTMLPPPAASVASTPADTAAPVVTETSIPSLEKKISKAPVKHTQAAPKKVANTAAHDPSVSSPQAAEPAAKAASAKPVCANCGTVEAVTPIQREGKATGAGAVAGAVLGGLVGNQFGGGDGKTVATVVGALGGGWAGNTVEKRMKKDTVYQVEVRMEDGSLRTLEQNSPATVGARVTVDGNTITPVAP